MASDDPLNTPVLFAVTADHHAGIVVLRVVGDLEMLETDRFREALRAAMRESAHVGPGLLAACIHGLQRAQRRARRCPDRARARRPLAGQPAALSGSRQTARGHRSVAGAGDGGRAAILNSRRVRRAKSNIGSASRTQCIPCALRPLRAMQSRRRGNDRSARSRAAQGSRRPTSVARTAACPATSSAH